ncbi:MAG: AAA family ATPase [Bacilli bacterium]|nr:AAA family ATPase [Bacilli bacterium]MBP3921315.1 AAA family ATPase [Bacilli bacterium]
MEPAIRPDILPLEFGGKKIIAVYIDEISQNRKPCYYKPKGIKNGSYTRVGDKDELMTDYELYALQSYKEHVIEDKRPNKNASIDDLYVAELEKYINKVKVEKPNFAKNDFNKCLKLSGIIDNSEEKSYPTLAGTLIFGEYPQSFYPQLFIACSVIPGIELGDTGSLGERFIDNKRVEGTIEEMLEGTMNFLQRNMKTSVIINSDGKRTDRTEYPMEALREAIANALIHRDYSIQTENAYISVYMYNDRIEIINPGALYGTNRIDKLGTATTMESRNTTIVRILEEKGSVIENRHSGIPTMRREMKNYGLPEPEFYEERDSFKVIFRNNNVVHGGQQNIKVSGQQGGQQATIEYHKNKVLEYCQEAKTAKEIKEYLNISSRQYISTNIIRPLINEGKLDYTNKNSVNAKNQKYITIKK